MPNERTGHYTWLDWDFDYEVADKEGLTLRNVKYKNFFILYKGSIPVIRVKYTRDWQPWWPYDCGPFVDQIRWTVDKAWLDPVRGPYRLVKDPVTNNEFIGLKTYTRGTLRWLEIGVYMRIGAYHLYQAWYLTDDADIKARVWSRGLSCNMAHTHHGYFRLDFDIETAGNNAVYFRDNGVWTRYNQEANDYKRPSADFLWDFRNQSSGRGVWIKPGKDDGSADGFSNLDCGIRLYHDAEDRPWPWGAKGDLGDLNGEPVGNGDIVFWYIPHLRHVAHGGGDQWHAMGPNMQVHV